MTQFYDRKNYKLKNLNMPFESSFNKLSLGLWICKKAQKMAVLLAVDWDFGKSHTVQWFVRYTFQKNVNCVSRLKELNTELKNVIFLYIPLFPFWKNVPENMLCRPENSFLLNASFIKGHEFKTTMVFVPKKMLNMSPYIWPSFLQLLPTFFTSINGICPTKGKPAGPKKSVKII